jgi:hypothetical protein
MSRRRSVAALTIGLAAWGSSADRDLAGAAALQIGEETMADLFPGVGYRVVIGSGGCEPFSSVSYSADVSADMLVEHEGELLARVEEYWLSRDDLQDFERYERPKRVAAFTDHAGIFFSASERFEDVRFSIDAGGCASEPIPRTKYTVPAG